MFTYFDKYLPFLPWDMTSEPAMKVDQKDRNNTQVGRWVYLLYVLSCIVYSVVTLVNGYFLVNDPQSVYITVGTNQESYRLISHYELPVVEVNFASAQAAYDPNLFYNVKIEVFELNVSNQTDKNSTMNVTYVDCQEILSKDANRYENVTDNKKYFRSPDKRYLCPSMTDDQKITIRQVNSDIHTSAILSIDSCNSSKYNCLGENLLKMTSFSVLTLENFYQPSNISQSVVAKWKRNRFLSGILDDSTYMQSFEMKSSKIIDQYGWPYDDKIRQEAIDLIPGIPEKSSTALIPALATIIESISTAGQTVAPLSGLLGLMGVKTAEVPVSPSDPLSPKKTIALPSDVRRYYSGYFGTDLEQVTYYTRVYRDLSEVLGEIGGNVANLLLAASILYMILGGSTLEKFTMVENVYDFKVKDKWKVLMKHRLKMYFCCCSKKRFKSKIRDVEKIDWKLLEDGKIETSSGVIYMLFDQLEEIFDVRVYLREMLALKVLLSLTMTEYQRTLIPLAFLSETIKDKKAEDERDVNEKDNKIEADGQDLEAPEKKGSFSKPEQEDSDKANLFETKKTQEAVFNDNFSRGIDYKRAFSQLDKTLVKKNPSMHPRPSPHLPATDKTNVGGIGDEHSRIDRISEKIDNILKPVIQMSERELPVYFKAIRNEHITPDQVNLNVNMPYQIPDDGKESEEALDSRKRDPNRESTD